MSVIWYDSSEAGAPVLNNAAGALLSVLQACLVDGFNTKSVTSLSVTANVATATISAHGYSGTYGKPVRVGGASVGALNGDKQITVVDANTVTFPAPGVANGTATGTITMKRAPLDWVRVFTGTNKAVYRSGDPASTQIMLRLDDTNAGVASAFEARARMYETMTDVDTGTGPGPTDAQTSGGQYWTKGANSATAKKWQMIGDGRLFYFFTEGNDSTGAGLFPHAFGDIVSYRAGDPYGCYLGGWTDQAGDGGVSRTGGMFRTGSNGEMIAAVGVLTRGASGVGGAVRAQMLGMRNALGTGVPGGDGNPTFPSPVDNGCVVQRTVHLKEENAVFGHPVRGEMPGLMFPYASAFAHLEVVPNVIGLAGQALAHGLFVNDVGARYGRVFFDITGPWR